MSILRASSCLYTYAVDDSLKRLLRGEGTRQGKPFMPSKINPLAVKQATAPKAMFCTRAGVRAHLRFRVERVLILQ